MLGTGYPSGIGLTIFLNFATRNLIESDLMHAKLGLNVSLQAIIRLESKRTEPYRFSCFVKSRRPAAALSQACSSDGDSGRLTNLART